MKQISTNHFFEEKVDIEGFSMSNCLEGEEVKILTKGFFNSDQKDFHLYIKGVAKLFLIKTKFLTNDIGSFLILVHDNGTTDIYFNIPYSISLINKTEKKAGDVITEEDIANIQNLKIKDVNITPNDKIIVCFRAHWRFGLYIDLSKTANLPELEIELGHFYRDVLFKDFYDVLDNEDMFNDGWFPFFKLIPNRFIQLSSYYGEELDRKNKFIESFVNEYDKEITSIMEKWWDKPIFNDKKNILEIGIKSYLNGDNISCIKTLYSEIDGILRILYYKETLKDSNFNELKEFIKSKALKKFDDYSLGFPLGFFDYLDKIIFKSFYLSKNETDLTRHTVLHGVAKEDDYTKVKAFQAILLLDQIYFYI